MKAKRHRVRLNLDRVKCKWELVDGDKLIDKGCMTADARSLIINAKHVYTLINTINELQEVEV